MALTGIQIYKLLPRTNCRECKFPTCLAFAMQVATGKVELAVCPYVSEEAKATLGEASAPPIRPITIGSGDYALKIGEETVLFRHDKTFVHPSGLAILIEDTSPAEEVKARLKQLDDVRFERVGLTLRADLVALKNTSGRKESFLSLVEQVKDTLYGIVLMSEDSEIMAAAAEMVKDKKPLLYAATPDNAGAMAEVAKAKTTGAALVASAKGLDALSELSDRLIKAGVKDIIIDSSPGSIGQALYDQTAIRRLALQKRFKPFGFPTIAFPGNLTADPMKEALYASVMIEKYAGIIVLSGLEAYRTFPLLVHRLNIYTDPQRPMTMSQGIYEVNAPAKESVLAITTNFSLTYFIVNSEIEASKVPTWLLIMDTDGLSTLTAWSAGKFVADLIAPFVKKTGIEEKIAHRNLIIPGYVAQLKGELEEELGDAWQVTVGPREASDLPSFLQKLAA
ncbi:MAG: acetyl-CoA decarbonylase/synthase complex subunit gamma [bacterium]|nr:acetyl-CoA decarbonylase/synthase complex subunit gamma [bacterium]